MKACSNRLVRNGLRTVSIGLMLTIVAVLVTGCVSSDGNNADSAPIIRSWDEMPAMQIDPKASYTAKVKTNKGSFEIELFAEEAPQTVNNFVFLAKQRYFDDITFHRIIDTFMIQTGDPNGDGTGGPGYTIPDELNSERRYEPGIVAMAKTMEPNSGGSQFFICTGVDATALNMNPDYTIFGKVKSGMDVVQRIASTPVESNPHTGEQSKPVELVKIQSITIKEQ